MPLHPLNADDSLPKKHLTAWGWSDLWQQKAVKLLDPQEAPARVSTAYRGAWVVQTPYGEMRAEITGRFRHEAKHPSDYPTIGDWVAITTADKQLAMIHRVFPRQSLLSRKTAGKTTEEQILAANVDVVFIVTAFDHDFNIRRLERYAALCRQAGIDPIILINKSDLAETLAPVDQLLSAMPEVRVVSMSAKQEHGIDRVRGLILDGQTAVFLGSSGVGKSTLINALLEQDVQQTQDVRESDQRGRHTTTIRQLFCLPNGGLVIDTPGIRELQLWADEAVLPDVFNDILELSNQCHFNDCRHNKEPHCAIQKAISDGTLPSERYESYLKLQKELAYLKRKKDPKEQANTKRRWKKIHRTLRDQMKHTRPDPH